MIVAFSTIKISNAIAINIFTKKCENFQSIKCDRNKFASRKVTENHAYSCIYIVGNNKLHARLLLNDNCAILEAKVNSFL